MSVKKSKRPGSLVVALVIAALLMAALTVSIRLGHYFQSLESEANKFRPYQDLYRALAGYDSPQKTLLVLANNAEIRTGGGFIGTLGLVNSNQGKIKADPLVGVYSIDSPDYCRDKNYSQPDYLAINLIDCSSLRDSSNYLDFPSNAKRVMYFYQLNTSIGVNNVVQITPEVLETLLDKLGPVYLKDYNLTVTKDNFRDTVQLEVEAGKDKLQKKDPKSGVIGSLSNILVSRLLSKDILEIKNILPNLQALIDQKQIVMYSSNPQTETLIRKIGAAGELSKTDENYFMMTESNFAANKSSPYIKNTVNMHQAVQPDGSSQIDLEIISEHTSPNRISYIDPNTNKLMWLVGEDKSYITLALPDDTQLISANVGSRPSNQKIENGKLLLSYYRYIQPLSQNKVVFSYKVPTRYLFGDRLVINSLVQKQLGGWPYIINYSLTLPSDEYQITASSVKGIKKQVGNGNTVFYTGNVDQDQVLSFIYEKP